MKKRQKRSLAELFPGWAVVPLLFILAVNCLVYWGSGILTADIHHYDFTMNFDRAVPLIPEFIWIYILAYVFWAANYILSAQRGKDIFYRFVATDLTVHLVCFILFLVLPTTNVRPEITGNSLSEQMLRLIYMMDGGSSPSNLFPSIHCYVSWLCWRGLKGADEIPKWYQNASLVFAVLIIVSTQVLKQHYIVDAIGGVVLVEAAWRFYQKGNRHRIVEAAFERFNEKIWKQKEQAV
ncbi:MAG: phosphatase PAP2 family protein [Eubacteriales bacterium]|nr:phosphatase PAP2 family protein [Eubacteriales bacterium]